MCGLHRTPEDTPEGDRLSGAGRGLRKHGDVVTNWAEWPAAQVKSCVLIPTPNPRVIADGIKLRGSHTGVG